MTDNFDNHHCLTDSFVMSTADKIRGFFDEEGLYYTEMALSGNLMCFELGFSQENRTKFKARVYINNLGDKAKICRIDVVMPICADPVYDYMLCKELIKHKFDAGIGAWVYDESNGEVFFKYNYLINHGLIIEDFSSALFTAIGVVDDEYAQIKKCCAGKFKTGERLDICKNLDDLVEGLKDVG